MLRLPRWIFVLLLLIGAPVHAEDIWFKVECFEWTCSEAEMTRRQSVAVAPKGTKPVALAEFKGEIGKRFEGQIQIGKRFISLEGLARKNKENIEVEFVFEQGEDVKLYDATILNRTRRSGCLPGGPNIRICLGAEISQEAATRPTAQLWTLTVSKNKSLRKRFDLFEAP